MASLCKNLFKMSKCSMRQFLLQYFLRTTRALKTTGHVTNPKSLRNRGIGLWDWTFSVTAPHECKSKRRKQSGNLDVENSWFTLCEPNEQMVTRHSTVGNLVKPRFNRDIRKNFFTVRAVDQWNSLPSNIKSSPTINQFKEAYDKFILN